MTYQTKWELISSEERESLQNTSCNLNCVGCSIYLKTEADFAKHFIVTDPKYKNLGSCPLTLLNQMS